MLIIGERINTSRPAIKKAVQERDKAFILNETQKQIEAGASMVDVNCGTSLDKELLDMLWLINTIQEKSAISLCIDSPDAAVLKEALKIHKGRAIINSITAEKSRYEKILPLCKDHDCLLIALTLDEKGMPETAQDRFELATIIMEICQRYGIPKDSIYFDPLVRPISAEQKQAKEFLGAIKLIKELGLKTIAGLSNISFGLPKRQLLNKAFLPMALAFGLDACIIDPLEDPLMATLLASSAILDQDEYCRGYLNAYREGKL